jgi:hypothetical protein
MVRRIVLAMAFVAALAVVGVGAAEKASAHGPYFGTPVGYGYGGYGGYGIVPTGGYHTAALRMGGYVPLEYYNGYYGGYPYGLRGNIGPVGGYYGGSSNTIIIGF